MRRILGATVVIAAATVASAGPSSEVAGRVLSTAKQPVPEARVIVRVKAWPGGTLRLTDHDARSDAKGRFRLPDILPAGTRYGVWIAAVAPGWALTSRYHESAKPEPMPAADLVTAPAHPLRLRFVDGQGKPVKGVAASPRMRGAADGVRHRVVPPARDAIVVRSGADGVVPMSYFLAGEWASVDVAFPGRDGEARHLLVPTANDATIDVPEAAPATPDRELQTGGDAARRFFLTGPKAGDREPGAGFGLVLVLPGGDGGEGFRSWVRERYDDWVDAGWVWAQLVAPKWNDAQRVVWPVAGSDVEGLRFTTEEFVAAVVEEAAKHVKIDRRRVLALGWSSSGPALYRIAMQKESPVTGYLIAMSVFHPEEKGLLANAKGRPFFLLHSPEDRTCPIRLAEKARDTLTKSGAKVEWATYEGGHGWAGESEDRAREGLRWLAERLR